MKRCLMIEVIFESKEAKKKRQKKAMTLNQLTESNYTGNQISYAREY